MSIERDEWLYVRADTAEKAREFFGVPADREVHEVGASFVTSEAGVLWAVKSPWGPGKEVRL